MAVSFKIIITKSRRVQNVLDCVSSLSDVKKCLLLLLNFFNDKKKSTNSILILIILNCIANLHELFRHFKTQNFCIKLLI